MTEPPKCISMHVLKRNNKVGGREKQSKAACVFSFTYKVNELPPINFD